nr:hypothetical protein Itr_chr11CG13670 [Ipomoea trifida]
MAASLCCDSLVLSSNNFQTSQYWKINKFGAVMIILLGKKGIEMLWSPLSWRGNVDLYVNMFTCKLCFCSHGFGGVKSSNS